MKSKYETFDRSRLLIKPLSERVHDLRLEHWLALDAATPPCWRSSRNVWSPPGSGVPRESS